MTSQSFSIWSRGGNVEEFGISMLVAGAWLAGRRRPLRQCEGTGNVIWLEQGKLDYLEIRKGIPQDGNFAVVIKAAMSLWRRFAYVGCQGLP